MKKLFFLLLILIPRPSLAVSYLGYNTIGGSMTTAFSAVNIRAIGPFVAAEQGTATRIELYTNAGGNNCTFGLYSDSSGSPNTRLAESAGGLLNGGSGTDDWRGQNISYSFSGGTKLYLALACDGGGQDVFYDVVGPGNNTNGTNTYSAGNMPDPFPTNTYQGLTPSIRLIYTPTSLIQSVGAGICAASNDTVATTAAYNSTGANFLVAIVTDYTAAIHTTVTSASPSTAWSELFNIVGAVRTTLWYAKNASVGSAQTYIATSDFGPSYNSICVMAFSGVDTTAPADGSMGSAFSGSPMFLGSAVTPAEDGALVIVGLGFDQAFSALAIDGGFSTPPLSQPRVSEYGTAISYSIQGTAAAVNPASTYTGSSGASEVLASFKPNATTSPGTGSLAKRR